VFGSRSSRREVGPHFFIVVSSAYLKADPSIHSCVGDSKHVTLHALELNYDPKSPRFGAGPREDTPGLYVEWATEDSGMVKGDRYCFQATG